MVPHAGDPSSWGVSSAHFDAEQHACLSVDAHYHQFRQCLLLCTYVVPVALNTSQAVDGAALQWHHIVDMWSELGMLQQLSKRIKIWQQRLAQQLFNAMQGLQPPGRLLPLLCGGH